MPTKMALTIYGDYSIIFANPEALVLYEKWRKMIQTSVYQTNLFGIVADEAHVILYVYCYLFTEVLWDNLGKLFPVVTVLCESLEIYKAKIKPFFILLPINYM